MQGRFWATRYIVVMRLRGRVRVLEGSVDAMGSSVAWPVPGAYLSCDLLLSLIRFELVKAMQK